MTTQLDWKAINEPLHIHLNPVKVIQLLHNRWFGISLIKISPDELIGPPPQEKALHNHVWSHIRFMAPGRLSESVCELGNPEGVVRRKVGLISRVNAETFLGERSVRRPTWVLVLNGKAEATCGKLVGYSLDCNEGQAHFEPLFEPPTDEIARPQIVT